MNGKKFEFNKRKLYGEYDCNVCGHYWTSHNSWTNEKQECRECLSFILPFNQYRLKKKGNPKADHDPKKCSFCKYLNSNCKYIIKSYYICDCRLSSNTKENDYRIKWASNIKEIQECDCNCKVAGENGFIFECKCGYCEDDLRGNLFKKCPDCNRSIQAKRRRIIQYNCSKCFKKMEKLFHYRLQKMQL